MKKNLSEVEHLFNQKQLNRILNTKEVKLESLKHWYGLSKGIMVDADLDKECINVMEVNNISEIDCTK
jgi:hypothetical protein